MIAWLIRKLCAPDGVYVPASEGGILRVPADTPDEDWDKTLEDVRAARRLLETKPSFPPRGADDQDESR